MAKRHHYVPVVYLRKFVNLAGKLLVYRKDEPQQCFPLRPETTGFQKYYYSQFDGNGVRDDDSIERIFGEVENHWPKVIRSLEDRSTMFSNAPNLIMFVALMRVRGPAFRDMVELERAHTVKSTLRAMLQSGHIEPPPLNLSVDDVLISIDPHQSLVAMTEGMKAIAVLLQSLHFDVLHNQTNTPFLTSDNPVIYFDPSRSGNGIRPYSIAPDGSVEVLFPLTSKMLLRGRIRPKRSDIGHRTLSDVKIVRRVNRLIARFAYQSIFAPKLGFERVIVNSAAESPVPRFDEVPDGAGGALTFMQMVFGPRPIKTKWDRS